MLEECLNEQKQKSEKKLANLNRKAISELTNCLSYLNGFKSKILFFDYNNNT